MYGVWLAGVLVAATAAYQTVPPDMAGSTEEDVVTALGQPGGRKACDAGELWC